jgi:hypothetical protein
LEDRPTTSGILSSCEHIFELVSEVIDFASPLRSCLLPINDKISQEQITLAYNLNLVWRRMACGERVQNERQRWGKKRMGRENGDLKSVRFILSIGNRLLG